MLFIPALGEAVRRTAALVVCETGSSYGGGSGWYSEAATESQSPSGVGKLIKHWNMTLDYLTDEFIRRDCGIHGAEFSDEDCQRIRKEVFLLHSKGEFHHAGVYWIANRLVAEGVIHPQILNYREW